MVLILLDRHQNGKPLGVGNISHIVPHNLLLVPHLVCLHLVIAGSKVSTGSIVRETHVGQSTKGRYEGKWKEVHSCMHVN